MRCSQNIEVAGRVVRGVLGVALLGAASVVALVAEISPAVRFPLALLLAGIGAFVIFEAAKGWCAIRAMGFRTPL